MSQTPIVRIENNDTDSRFRDKVNNNFIMLARRAELYAGSGDGDTDVRSAHETFSAMIQPGGAASGSVSFSERFLSVPRVLLTAYRNDVIIAMTSTTEDGFSFSVRNIGSSVVTSVPFNWLAAS
jgi:hypothetical protein